MVNIELAEPMVGAFNSVVNDIGFDEVDVPAVDVVVIDTEY